MEAPTTDDAKLILKLVEIRQSEGQREAFEFVMTQLEAKDYAEFIEKCPHGSKEGRQVGAVLGFFETIGVLVSHGLLNEDLVFDLSFGLDPVWEKVGPILPGWQKATMPALWENAIWLHKRYVAWRKNVWTPNLKWKAAARRRKK